MIKLSANPNIQVSNKDKLIAFKLEQEEMRREKVMMERYERHMAAYKERVRLTDANHLDTHFKKIEI